jgi:hypothetical protein
MFTHCVFFWLRDGLSADEKADFERQLKTLTTLPSVVYGTIGTPASTDRPVIDRSYSYGLMVAFKDLAGHDAYQVHPLHDAFRDNCAKYWTRVVIYDFDDAPLR